MFALCFISSVASVPAYALTVNGNEILSDFIVTTPRPYVVPYFQHGNQVVAWNRGFGQEAAVRSYTSSTGFYTWLAFSNAPNSINYSWINGGHPTASNRVDGPFHSLGYAGIQGTSPAILVMPRFSDVPTAPSSATSIMPYSVVLTVPQPTTEYHGLSLSFSKLNFGMSLSCPDGYPPYNGSLNDTYVSILINGKTLSTVRYSSSRNSSTTSTTGLTDIVTLDVTNRDIVSIVFSVYPPTVFQTSQVTSFRTYFTPYNYGAYKRVTYPLDVAGTLTYPLQYCWYSTAKTPSFDDGFTDGVPGDYEPGGGGSTGGGDNSEQLKEIQNSLNALGTSLEEYNANVEAMVGDVNQGLDQVDQSIKDSTATIMGDDSDPENPTGIKGIIATIKNLPQMMLDGLVHIFVPTEEDMQNIKQGYDELLQEKLGLGYQAIELVDTIFSSVIDNLNSSDAYSFTFPGIQFPMNGEIIVILPETPVSLDNKVMGVLRPVAGTAVTLISILAFVNMLKNFIENFLSGKGIADFDGSG